MTLGIKGCHVERSETSLNVLRCALGPKDQRFFALLRMTGSQRARSLSRCNTLPKKTRSSSLVHSRILKIAGSVQRDSYVTRKKYSMAEASTELEGPDFEKAYETAKVRDGEMLLGHAFGEPVLVARRGEEFFAIGATCTHYGGPLAKGLMVDCTVRCAWHHARFDLRTGEAIAAPALNSVPCYSIEKRGEQFFVTGKIDKKVERGPRSSPGSVVIVGAGAAGGAAAEMLRREIGRAHV